MRWLFATVVCLHTAISFNIAFELYDTNKCRNIPAIIVICGISVVSLYISLYNISRKQDYNV